MSSQIAVKCGRCGNTQFRLPNARPSATDMVSCARCGASGRYGDLQRQAVSLAKTEIEKSFRNAFRGIKGITIR